MRVIFTKCYPCSRDSTVWHPHCQARIVFSLDCTETTTKKLSYVLILKCRYPIHKLLWCNLRRDQITVLGKQMIGFGLLCFFKLPLFGELSSFGHFACSNHLFLNTFHFEMHFRTRFIYKLYRYRFFTKCANPCNMNPRHTF